ncbi:MAG: hypothetical protein M1817_005242 [Caeruleum heppii]|nr:MAG: hypothetical protein M1817_005242 [Caeruleum heppii]
MPPHLHPRSRTTSTLFTTTLLFSFLIVGVPHLLPCPAPRREYADGPIDDVDDDEDPSQSRRRPRRRRRRPVRTQGIPSPLNQDAGSEREDGTGRIHGGEDEAYRIGEKKRECPVPKPGGRIGELLGFRETAREVKESVRTSK